MRKKGDSVVCAALANSNCTERGSFLAKKNPSAVNLVSYLLSLRIREDPKKCVVLETACGEGGTRSTAGLTRQCPLKKPICSIAMPEWLTL